MNKTATALIVAVVIVILGAGVYHVFYNKKAETGPIKMGIATILSGTLQLLVRIW